MTLRSIPGGRLPNWVENLRYSIDVFDERDNLVEVLGRVSELDLAKVTFRAACIKHPKKRIFVREGARVISRSGEP